MPTPLSSVQCTGRKSGHARYKGQRSAFLDVREALPPAVQTEAAKDVHVFRGLHNPHVLAATTHFYQFAPLLFVPDTLVKLQD
jgi:hypothetical protein